MASVGDLNPTSYREVRGASQIQLTDCANTCLSQTQLIGEENKDWPGRPGEVQQLSSLPELGDPLKIIHTCHILLDQLCCNIFGVNLDHNESRHHCSLHLRQLAPDHSNQISQLGEERRSALPLCFPTAILLSVLRLEIYDDKHPNDYNDGKLLLICLNSSTQVCISKQHPVVTHTEPSRFWELISGYIHVVVQAER